MWLGVRRVMARGAPRFRCLGPAENVKSCVLAYHTGIEYVKVKYAYKTYANRRTRVWMQLCAACMYLRMQGWHRGRRVWAANETCEREGVPESIYVCMYGNIVSIGVSTRTLTRS